MLTPNPSTSAPMCGVLMPLASKPLHCMRLYSLQQFLKVVNYAPVHVAHYSIRAQQESGESPNGTLIFVSVRHIGDQFNYKQSALDDEKLHSKVSCMKTAENHILVRLFKSK